MMFMALNPDVWVTTTQLEEATDFPTHLSTSLAQAVEAGLLERKRALEVGGDPRHIAWSLSQLMKDYVHHCKIRSSLTKGTGFVDDRINISVNGKILGIDVSDIDLVLDELLKYRALRDANSLR